MNETFPIRLFGDPVLRRRAAPVARFDEELRRFVGALGRSMLASDGAGLAAPQVGVPLRIFTLAGSYAGVLDPSEEHDAATELAAVRAFINPIVLEADGAKVDVEGCLSIPGLYAEVPRAARLRLSFQDAQGEAHEVEAEGLMAKAIQHELDHLEGILFLDRLPAAVRQQLLEEHRGELAQMQRDARAHLKELQRAKRPQQPWP